MSCSDSGELSMGEGMQASSPGGINHESSACITRKTNQTRNDLQMWTSHNTADTLPLKRRPFNFDKNIARDFDLCYRTLLVCIWLGTIIRHQAMQVHMHFLWYLIVIVVQTRRQMMILNRFLMGIGSFFFSSWQHNLLRAEEVADIKVKHFHGRQWTQRKRDMGRDRSKVSVRTPFHCIID